MDTDAQNLVNTLCAPCRFLGQAENSLACLYITPKGFALHAALLSFSIDAQH